MTIEQDPRISETVRRERSRLLAFIRRRVGDANEAQDILQEAFYELVEAFRIVQPVENIGPWLFRVIRNRIIDFYRAKRHEVSMNEPVAGEDDSDSVELQDLLPSRDAGPEAAFAQSVLLEELRLAIDELPAEQRAVFIANEFEGYAAGADATATIDLRKSQIPNGARSLDRLRCTVCTKVVCAKSFILTATPVEINSRSLIRSQEGYMRCCDSLQPMRSNLKFHAQAFSHLALVLVFALAMAGTVAAQVAPPVGPYGFVLNATFSDPVSDNSSRRTSRCGNSWQVGGLSSARVG